MSHKLITISLNNRQPIFLLSRQVPNGRWFIEKSNQPQAGTNRHHHTNHAGTQHTTNKYITDDISGGSLRQADIIYREPTQIKKAKKHCGTNTPKKNEREKIREKSELHPPPHTLIRSRNNVDVCTDRLALVDSRKATTLTFLARTD